MTNIVVYTDLDGTLLDHESYEPGPARELLMLLADRGIPVVPCTSKPGQRCCPSVKTWDSRGRLSSRTEQRFGYPRAGVCPGHRGQGRMATIGAMCWANPGAISAAPWPAWEGSGPTASIPCAICRCARLARSLA